MLIEQILVRRLVCVYKVELCHRIHRYDVDMGVWHFETGDHQADSGRGKDRLLGLANAMGDGHEVRCGGGGEVSPLIDLLAWHDQGVARS